MFKLIEKINGIIKEYPLESKGIFIGRTSDNDIVIENTHVSRCHLLIKIDDNQNITIIDQNSANGTYINNKKLSPRKPFKYALGDRIRIGVTDIELFLDRVVDDKEVEAYRCDQDHDTEIIENVRKISDDGIDQETNDSVEEILNDNSEVYSLAEYQELISTNNEKIQDTINVISLKRKSQNHSKVRAHVKTQAKALAQLQDKTISQVQAMAVSYEESKKQYSELIQIQSKKIELMRERAIVEINGLREESLLETHEQALKLELEAKENAEKLEDDARLKAEKFQEEAKKLSDELLKESEMQLVLIDESIQKKKKATEVIDHEIVKAKEKLEKLHLDIASEESKKNELVSLSEEMLSELFETETNINNEKKRIKQIQDEISIEKSNSKKEIERIESNHKLKIEILNNEIESLLSKKENIKNNCDELKKSQEIVTEELAYLKDQREELDNSVLEQKASIKNLESLIHDHKESYTVCSQDLDKIKSVIHENQLLVVELKNKINELDSEYDEKNLILQRDYASTCESYQEKKNELEHEFLQECTNIKKRISEEEKNTRLEITNELVKIQEEIEEKKKLSLNLEKEISEKRVFFDAKVKEVEDGLEKKKLASEQKIIDKEKSFDEKMAQRKSKELQSLDEKKKEVLSELDYIKTKAKKEGHDIRKAAGLALVMSKKQIELREEEASQKIKNIEEELQKQKQEAGKTCELLRKSTEEKLNKIKQEAILENKKIIEKAIINAKKITQDAKDNALKIEQSSLKGAKQVEMSAEAILNESQLEKKKLLSECKATIDNEITEHRRELEAKKNLAETEIENTKNEQLESLNIYKLKELKKTKKEIAAEFELSKENEKKRISTITENLILLINHQYRDTPNLTTKPSDSNIKKIVRASFYGEKELEGSKLKSILFINSDSSLQMKLFIKRVATRYVIPALCLIIVYYNYPHIIDFIKKNNEAETTSEVFVQKLKKERESKFNFNPEQDLLYKESYVKNVLYTKGYADLALNKDFQSQYIIKLNSFVLDDLGLDESIVVSLSAIHTDLIRNILNIKDNIISGFEKSEIEKMKSLEQEAIAKQRKLLRTKTKYDLFKTFEQDFYYSF